MEREQLVILSIPEDKLEQGQWVYTPDEVFGSGGKEHNIFQYDKRIDYALHFGHNPIFIKIDTNQ